LAAAVVTLVCNYARLCRRVFAAAAVKNLRTGRTSRRKAQFMLMELVPMTLQAALTGFPMGTLVPYPWVVRVLAGVRVALRILLVATRRF
jgi:hypothetical protein